MSLLRMTKESLDITSYCMRGRNKQGTCIADDGRVMIEKFTTFELNFRWSEPKTKN